MKQDISQQRIALFTLDSALSNGAIIRFISRNRDKIQLVIASSPLRRQGRGASKSLPELCWHSGARLCMFLTYGFVLFPVLLKANYLLCKFMGRSSDFIPIKDYCNRCGIAYRLSEDINDGQLAQLLRDREIDLIITCFFDQILGPDIISVPRLACLNVHPGLLPECRGVLPEFHTAAGKCADFGFTIHVIDDATIDTGRILVRKSVTIPGGNSLLAIGRRLLAEGLIALEEALTDLNAGLAQLRSQGSGNYYSYPGRADIRNISRKGYVLMSWREIITDICQAGKSISGSESGGAN